MAQWTIRENALPALPEVRLIGRAITPLGGWRLPPHMHESMEISYLHRGAVRWWAGDEWTDLRGGETYVTWPGEQHGGSLNALGGCTLYWLQIAVPESDTEPFLDLPSAEAQACLRALGQLPRRFASPDLSAVFDRMLNRLRIADELAVTAVRADLLTILLTLVDAARRPDGRMSKLTTDALAIMHAHLTSPLDVQSVASQLGVSVSYVQQRFRREVGVGPAEYHLRLRIEEAKTLLRTTDEPVTTIAVQLGFSSSQYFATAFRRLVGVRPTRYRAIAASPEVMRTAMSNPQMPGGLTRSQ